MYSNINKKFNSLYFLLLVNSIIFIFAFLVQTKGFDSKFFYLFGGEITSKIFGGDIWLLLTSNFFHLDILHFILNMYALWKIGEAIMTYYDGKKLFFIYIFGGIAGSLLTFLISLPSFITNGESSNVFSLGASGSIFAMVGLLLGGTLRKNRFGTGLPFKTSDILIFALPSFLLGLTPGLNINNWAHVGGLLSGILLGLLLRPVGNYESKTEEKIFTFIYYLSLIIFFLSYLFLAVNAYKLIFL